MWNAAPAAAAHASPTHGQRRNAARRRTATAFAGERPMFRQPAPLPPVPAPRALRCKGAMLTLIWTAPLRPAPPRQPFAPPSAPPKLQVWWLTPPPPPPPSPRHQQRKPEAVGSSFKTVAGAPPPTAFPDSIRPDATTAGTAFAIAMLTPSTRHPVRPPRRHVRPGHFLPPPAAPIGTFNAQIRAPR